MKGLAFRLSTVGSLLAVSVACAGPNTVARSAPRVAFTEIAQGQPGPAVERLQHVPFVLHVQQGQEIPVEFGLDSSLFSFEPGPMKLVAKRDFYVLFRKDGPPLLSDDGVEFEKRPKNAFMFGLSVQKDQPAKVELRLRVRAEEPAAK
jgi:hypothetical protein